MRDRYTYHNLYQVPITVPTQIFVESVGAEFAICINDTELERRRLLFTASTTLQIRRSDQEKKIFTGENKIGSFLQKLRSGEQLFVGSQNDYLITISNNAETSQIPTLNIYAKRRIRRLEMLPLGQNIAQERVRTSYTRRTGINLRLEQNLMST